MQNIDDFLEALFAELGLSRTHPHVRYIPFLDADEDNDDHLENLLAGKVSAGFRARAWYVEQAMRWGEENHILVLTDFYGMAKAVGKIRHCEIVLYKDVDEELALEFGYGDGSLSVWRQRSRNVIAKDCIFAGIKFDAETELLVTKFDILYPYSS